MVEEEGIIDTSRTDKSLDRFRISFTHIFLFLLTAAKKWNFSCAKNQLKTNPRFDSSRTLDTWFSRRFSDSVWDKVKMYIYLKKKFEFLLLPVGVERKCVRALKWENEKHMANVVKKIFFVRFSIYIFAVIPHCCCCSDHIFPFTSNSSMAAASIEYGKLYPSEKFQCNEQSQREKFSTRKHKLHLHDSKI